MRSPRKTLIRSLKWLSTGVLLLVLSAVLVVELMPWNFLKPTLSRQVEATLGRPLTLDGDLSFSLFPRPAASIGNVTLGNPDWSDSPHLITVGRIEASTALLPLFTGNLVLTEVSLVEVELNLEPRPDGAGNWRFERLSSTEADDTPREEQGRSAPVAVEHVSVARATLRYFPSQAEQPVEVSVPKFDVYNDGDSLDAVAEMAYRERDFRAEANADALSRWLDGSAEATVNTIVTSEGGQLRSVLTRPRAEGFAGLQGSVDLTLENPGRWSQWLGGPALNLGSLRLSGRVDRRTDQWRFTDLDATVADNRVSGRITLHTGPSPTRFDADLTADEFDVGALRQALPPASQPNRREDVQVPVFPAVNGTVDLGINRLRVRGHTLQDLQTTLSLADHSLVIESLSFTAAQGTVTGEARLTSGPDTLSAEASVSLDNIDTDAIPGLPGLFGSVDADLALALAPLPASPAYSAQTVLEQLSIDRAQADYRSARYNAEAALQLELEEASRVPTLRVDGRFRQQPFRITVTGAPLPGLLTDADYPLQAEATAAGVDISAQSRLAALTSPDTLTADVRISGEDTAGLETLLGMALPALPPFELAGRLARDQAVWSATGLDLALGDTRLHGLVRLHQRERPLVAAELSGSQIDLQSLLTLNEPSPSQRDSDTTANQGEDRPLALMNSADLRLDVRTDAVTLAQNLELRDLTLNAELDNGRLVVDPLQANLAGGSATASGVLDAQSPPATGRMDARFEAIALSRLSDTFTVVEERLGVVSGELHIDATQAEAGAIEDSALLPFIGRLRFDESRLRFTDAEADTDLELRFRSRGLTAGEQRFHLDGEGRYAGDPFSLRLTGDPLLNTRLTDEPYALEMVSEAVDTQFNVEGTVTRPWSLQGIDLELAVSGPNTSRLEAILGFPMPNLPPYSLSSNLSLQDSRWTLTEIDGSAGDSDLGGELALDAGVSPPHISGQLASESLNLEDLGGLIGVDPEEEPDAQTEEPAAEDRLVLPREPVLGRELRGVSADLGFNGRSVKAADIPLTDLVIDFQLDNGQMRLDPVSFGVGEGSVDLSIDLDATTSPPEGRLTTEVRSVDLDVALQNWALAEDSVGIVGGKGQFWVSGASVGDLFASADGGMVLLMTDGQLDALLVELAGLDMGEALFAWLGDRMAVPIHCAYADITAEDGVATLDTAIVDSTDSLFTAGGTVDFNTEVLDITFLTHPKDFGLLVGRTPLHLGGTFAEIEPGLHPSDLSLRLASSLALSAIAAPIAALTPLLDPGTEEDVDYCQGMVSRIREATQQNGAEQ